MKKKLLVFAIALAMIFSFAACGGGGEAAPAESAETAEAAEPNAGIAGLVMTVPDEWELSNFAVGSRSIYSKADSALQLGISALTEEEFESYHEESIKTLQEFFDKYYTISEDSIKANNLEVEQIKVCDSDAGYVKRPKGDEGYAVLSTSFICDNTIYEIFLTSPNAIEWESNGKIRDDAPVLSDEEVAMYESVVASTQKGDGNAIQKEQRKTMTVDSIGSMSFEAPAGFEIESVSDDFVSFGKEGSDIRLTINRTGPEDLNYISDENGEHPSTLEECYNKFYFYEGMDEVEIGGFSGYISKYPYEDDTYYDVSGGFLADDAIYDFGMTSDAFDWENDGALKEDAEALSKDDLAAFDAFAASFKKK